MRLVASILLCMAGLINVLAGFLALFPGLFEVAAASAGEPQQSSQVGVMELVGTRYGALAVCLLGVGMLQATTAGWLGLMLRWGTIPGLFVIVVGLAGLAVEIAGALVKSSFTGLNGFGSAVSVLVVYLGASSATRSGVG